MMFLIMSQKWKKRHEPAPFRVLVAVTSQSRHPTIFKLLSCTTLLSRDSLRDFGCSMHAKCTQSCTPCERSCITFPWLSSRFWLFHARKMYTKLHFSKTHTYEICTSWLYDEWSRDSAGYTPALLWDFCWEFSVWLDVWPMYDSTMLLIVIDRVFSKPANH